jgi:hypothetical protein
MFTADKAFTLDLCPKCHGGGIARNSRHLLYAVCLVGGGAMCFLQYPPAPTLFTMIGDLCAGLGLPGWTATALVRTLMIDPPLLGAAFFWTWLHGDTCLACKGHGRVATFSPAPEV